MLFDSSSPLLRLLTPSSRMSARPFVQAGEDGGLKSILDTMHPPTQDKQMSKLKGRILFPENRPDTAKYWLNGFSSYSCTQKIELTGRSQWYFMPGSHEGGLRSDG